MDLIDAISKHLRINKTDAEARVAKAHTDGNQVIFGGQARHDCDATPEVNSLPEPGSKEWDDMVDYMRADLDSGMSYTKLEMATRKMFEEAGRDFDAEFKAWTEQKEDEPFLLTDRVKSEHQDNVDFYLAGQPDDDVITFGQPEVEAIKVVEEGMHLPIEEIERRAKAIVAARVINADYDNGFDINECTALGCTKAVEGCCMAYRDPTLLVWHRHDKSCPTGPRMFHAMSAKIKQVNPLKASKRSTK